MARRGGVARRSLAWAAPMATTTGSKFSLIAYDAHSSALPPEITVFERGWLSSNNILFTDSVRAPRWWTRATARTAHRPWRWCNWRWEDGCRSASSTPTCTATTAAATPRCAAAWPQVHRHPAGQAAHVRNWDPYALSYTPTGQECPQFPATPAATRHRGLLGDRPGRCTPRRGTTRIPSCCSEPQDRIHLGRCTVGERLRRGLPELDGADAFGSGTHAGSDRTPGSAHRDPRPRPGVPRRPARPGRGTQAPRRLRQQPRQARALCRQVLLWYKLLEWQRIRLPDLHAWTSATPYFGAMHQRHFGDRSQEEWLEG